MTPEEQRIAIAEACGWKRTQIKMSSGNWFCGQDENPALVARPVAELPDYLNDINACFAMEDGLTMKQVPIYRVWLKKNADFATATFGPEWELIHATASQRCEAFLRTIGKWIE